MHLTTRTVSNADATQVNRSCQILNNELRADILMKNDRTTKRIALMHKPLPSICPHRPPPSQANVVPVVASNRVGREEFSGGHIDFYGSSFIADQTGEILSECSYVPRASTNPTKDGGGGGGGGMGVDAPRPGRSIEPCSAGASSGHPRHLSCGERGEVILHTFDLESIRLQRAGWGLFRDRRPSLYRPLLSLDGRASSQG